jgi:hypothetical protein
MPAGFPGFNVPASLDVCETTWTLTPLELVVGDAPLVFEIARTS